MKSRSKVRWRCVHKRRAIYVLWTVLQDRIHGRLLSCSLAIIHFLVDPLSASQWDSRVHFSFKWNLWIINCAEKVLHFCLFIHHWSEGDGDRKIHRAGLQVGQSFHLFVCACVCVCADTAEPSQNTRQQQLELCGCTATAQMRTRPLQYPPIWSFLCLHVFALCKRDAWVEFFISAEKNSDLLRGRSQTWRKGEEGSTRWVPLERAENHVTFDAPHHHDNWKKAVFDLRTGRNQKQKILALNWFWHVANL